MSHTKSGRSLEKVLLAAIGSMLLLIDVVSFARSILVPAEPALPTDRTGTPATEGFITVFTLAENAAAAFKTYQGHLLETIGILAIGVIGILYAGALLVYRAIFNLRFTRTPFTIAALSAIALFGGSVDQILLKSNIEDVSNCTRLQSMYDTREYKIAEGIVHVIHSQSTCDRGTGDSIRVGDASLEVCYYVSTCAYRQSIAHGGVLTEGTYARVYYTDNYYPDEDPPILRIDIKNP